MLRARYERRTVDACTGRVVASACVEAPACIGSGGGAALRATVSRLDLGTVPGGRARVEVVGTRDIPWSTSRCAEIVCGVPSCLWCGRPVSTHLRITEAVSDQPEVVALLTGLDLYWLPAGGIGHDAGSWVSAFLAPPYPLDANPLETNLTDFFSDTPFSKDGVLVQAFCTSGTPASGLRIEIRAKSYDQAAGIGDDYSWNAGGGADVLAQGPRGPLSISGGTCQQQGLDPNQPAVWYWNYDPIVDNSPGYITGSKRQVGAFGFVGGFTVTNDSRPLGPPDGGGRKKLTRLKVAEVF
jgi:hypothetical protein